MGDGVRRFYRCLWAVLFALIMLGVWMLPPGRMLEREYGLPLLYEIRGDVPVPQEALVIGLDNGSVGWLNRLAVGWQNDPGSLEARAPKLAGCLDADSMTTLLGAANINHLPRAVHACLLAELSARNARLVSFDINFNKQRPGDEVFRDAIAAAGNVLLFERVRFEEGLSLQRIEPRRMFREVALGTTAFRVDSERGEIATSYLTRIDPEDRVLPMPDKVWQEYTGQTRPAPLVTFQPIWLYGPPRTVRTVPLAAVFDPAAARTLPDDLSNTVVFIGSSDPEDAAIDDHFPVPTSGRGNQLIGGVELAATAFLNRLHGTMLHRPAPRTEGLIVFLVALAGGLTVALLSGRRLWLVIGAVSVGYLAVAAAAFQSALLWLPVAVPVFLTTLCVALMAISARYFFARALVTRLAPRQVASMLLEGTDTDRRATRTEQATIMFMDLKGSTGMAESMEEGAYTAAMSRYYDTATDVVEDNGGMVVEFLGDGIVAMFSHSVTGPEHAARACAAAQSLIARIRADNAEADPDGSLNIRIGINSGLTATGEIGARRRFNFKALGDVVTVASRLEQMGKTVIAGEAGEHVVLISGATQDAARLGPEQCEALGPLTVRGRQATLEVYRVRIG